MKIVTGSTPLEDAITIRNLSMCSDGCMPVIYLYWLCLIFNVQNIWDVLCLYRMWHASNCALTDKEQRMTSVKVRGANL